MDDRHATNPSIYTKGLSNNMPISQPSLPKDIEAKLKVLLRDLNAAVTESHIDGTVELGGYSRDGLGAQIIVQNLEEINGDEIELWKSLAKGARSIDYTADFGSGKIVFHVEYKRDLPCINCEWAIYPFILTILTLLLQVV